MLNVGFAEHNADWNWKNVSSPFIRILYIVGGEATVHFDDRSLALTPGHMYIIPPYTRHSYECTGPLNLYYLHLYQAFKNERDIFEYYRFPDEVKAEPWIVEVFRLMCKQCPGAALPESNPQVYDNGSSFKDYAQRYHQLPFYAKMRLRGDMLVLFSYFMEKAESLLPVGDERMLKVHNYINCNIDREISVTELSDMVYLAKPYFIRQFTQTFGVSPLKYIIKKKLEKAQLLLLTSDMQVQEIARMLSYNDHSYFVRQFRKTIGMAPNEYRQMMK